ncbi:MAG TPA: ABC transporter ATP-binding protein [Bacteriovoracaceae bacterium]|nr:ABC transporter ATP-binding protein [Bacteriovoracaceae bacterium]
MTAPLLSVRNLTVDFHTSEGVTRAVNNISFDIPAGKTIGIVGESGSGKSVTSLAVMGLLQKPAARIPQGEIFFDGKDILKFNDGQMREIRGNQISMIFQEPMTSLNPVFKVGDQIAETLRIHKNISKKEAWAQAVDLMNQVGIPNPGVRAHAYPHEMSGGQKQRVMIAMAISCEPKLLIADEPTTALDVTIQKQVLDLLFKLQQKYHMSMMFITHDLGVIGDIADDVVVMYRSNVVEKNNAKEIFTTAKHPYTKGLLACRPKLGANPRRLLTVSDFMSDAGEEKVIPASRIVVFDKETEPNKNDEILLEVKNLVTQFPIKGGMFGKTVDHVKAVDGVSFTLKKGRTLGLVGESGCGKTTLGRSILRLVEPTSGNIIYRGKDITHVYAEELRLLRRKMQIIFQDPYSSLNPRMTVAEILTEPLVIHKVGSSKAERLSMALELMEKVGLNKAQLNRYPHEFSGGQRQRISIARALMLRPEFVICDESVSALDVSIQAQVLNLLLDLQQEFGLTYIFISHDLSVVNFIADEVGVMYAGKIIEMDSANRIYRNPKEEYTRTLLSAIPKGETKSNLAALL